jgi:hypothetical protein
VKSVTIVIVLGVCASLLALAVVVLVLKHQTTNDRAKKLDRFCVITKMTIHDDGNALLSGDVERQKEAATHFWTKEIYQGADSVSYCMDELKVPQMPLRCPMLEDEKERWKCLANFASKVEQALP